MKQNTKQKPATRKRAAMPAIQPEPDETLFDSEFDSWAREANVMRNGCPLDYKREAAQLAAYMASDETPPRVTRLIAHYMDELSSSTNVGIHTPAVLRVAYPIMRFRDGASDGARVLLGIAINAVASKDERAALARIWATERERLKSEVAQ